MSFLVVPKRRAVGAAGPPPGWGGAAGGGAASGPGPSAAETELDRAAADIAVAQARSAAKLASQSGSLAAYRDFERTTEASRTLGRRPVHNERFLGNTLRQVDAHNRRQRCAAIRPWPVLARHPVGRFCVCFPGSP